MSKLVYCDNGSKNGMVTLVSSIVADLKKLQNGGAVSVLISESMIVSVYMKTFGLVDYMDIVVKDFEIWYLNNEIGYKKLLILSNDGTHEDKIHLSDGIELNNGLIEVNDSSLCGCGKNHLGELIYYQELLKNEAVINDLIIASGENVNNVCMNCLSILSFVNS